MKNQSPLPFVKGHGKTKYNESSGVFAFGQEVVSHKAGVSLLYRLRAAAPPWDFLLDPFSRMEAGERLGAMGFLYWSPTNTGALVSEG